MLTNDRTHWLQLQTINLMKFKIDFLTNAKPDRKHWITDSDLKQVKGYHWNFQWMLKTKTKRSEKLVSTQASGTVWNSLQPIYIWCLGKRFGRINLFWFTKNPACDSHFWATLWGERHTFDKFKSEKNVPAIDALESRRSLFGSLESNLNGD